MPDIIKKNNNSAPAPQNKVDNTKLKQALEKLAKENTPENINAVCEELVMNARLLVPGSFSKPPVNNEEGKAVLQKDTQINFQLLISPDKKQWFIAFTDYEEYEKWKKQAKVTESVNTLLLGFDELNALAQQNEASSGLLVNPFSAGFMVPRDVMRRFKEQKDSRRASGNGQQAAVQASMYNKKLKEALEKLVKENNQDNVNAVREELVTHARLIVPGAFSKPPVQDENGKVVLPKDTQINFQLLVTPDKKQWFIGFTDLEEFEKWKKQAKTDEPVSTMILSFDDFYVLALKNEASSGLVVNPFSAGFILPKEIMQQFKEPKNEQQEAEKEEQTVTVSDPRVFPERMTEALKKFYKTQKQVKSAYVRMLHHGKKSSNYLIIIDFEGEKQALFDKTAEIAKPFLGTYGLNITEYNSDLGKQSTVKSEPFYVKTEKKSFFSRKK